MAERLLGCQREVKEVKGFVRDVKGVGKGLRGVVILLIVYRGRWGACSKIELKDVTRMKKIV